MFPQRSPRTRPFKSSARHGRDATCQLISLDPTVARAAASCLLPSVLREIYLSFVFYPQKIPYTHRSRGQYLMCVSVRGLISLLKPRGPGTWLAPTTGARCGQGAVMCLDPPLRAQWGPTAQGGGEGSQLPLDPPACFAWVVFQILDPSVQSRPSESRPAQSRPAQSRPAQSRFAPSRDSPSRDSPSRDWRLIRLILVVQLDSTFSPADSIVPRASG